MTSSSACSERHAQACTAKRTTLGLGGKGAEWSARVLYGGLSRDMLTHGPGDTRAWNEGQWSRSPGLSRFLPLIQSHDRPTSVALNRFDTMLRPINLSNGLHSLKIPPLAFSHPRPPNRATVPAMSSVLYATSGSGSNGISGRTLKTCPAPSGAFPVVMARSFHARGNSSFNGHKSPKVPLA